MAAAERGAGETATGEAAAGSDEQNQAPQLPFAAQPMLQTHLEKGGSATLAVHHSDVTLGKGISAEVMVIAANLEALRALGIPTSFSHPAAAASDLGGVMATSLLRPSSRIACGRASASCEKVAFERKIISESERPI